MSKIKISSIVCLCLMLVVSVGVIVYKKANFLDSRETVLTVERLKDVATDETTFKAITNTDTGTSSFATTTALSKKLSSECDEVLATGSNLNGDHYEIVANTIEDYTGLSILVGVIKNNEWLLEPTKDMPFVLEENGFSSNGPEMGEIFYVGNNCFVATKKSTGGSNSPFASYAYMYIVYNVETGKSYSTATYRWAFKNQVPLIARNDEDYMIIGYENYSGLTIFNILNKTDMSVSTVEIEKSISYFSPASEGLFSVSVGDSNYPDYYFYDLNGNMVLDLSEYKTSQCQTVYFKNGKCQIEVINNNDSKYILTIDKNGNVLNSKELEE